MVCGVLFRSLSAANAVFPPPFVILFSDGFISFIYIYDRPDSGRWIVKGGFIRC